MKLKSIEKVFDFLSPDDLTSQIINYANSYDFVLTADVAKKYISISDISFIKKIIPNLDVIPDDLIEEFVFNIFDYDFIIFMEKLKSIDVIRIINLNPIELVVVDTYFVSNFLKRIKSKEINFTF